MKLCIGLYDNTELPLRMLSQEIQRWFGMRCANNLPYCLNSFSIQMSKDVRYYGRITFIGPLIEKTE